MDKKRKNSSLTIFMTSMAQMGHEMYFLLRTHTSSYCVCCQESVACARNSQTKGKPLRAPAIKKSMSFSVPLCISGIIIQGLTNPIARRPG